MSTPLPKDGAASVRGSLARIAALAALAAAGVVFVVVLALSLAGPREAANAGIGAAVELPVMPAAEKADALPPLPPAAGVDGGLVVVPYTAAAFAGLPALPAEEPLPPVTEPALINIGPTAIGPTGASPTANLPRTAGDGRRPRDVYARPFERRDNRPRLVVIVLDIGLSRAASEAAIRRLPGAVVLAVDAYAAKPADWARAARQAGHEILASVPLQGDVPGDDAGPRALPVAAGDGESLRRLEATLSRLDGCVGVLMRGGAGDDSETFVGLRPALEMLRGRGLLLVDGVVGGGAPLFLLAERLDLPRARLDVMIGDVDAVTVDRQLAALEATARERFVAVAAVRPTPTTLERLRSWTSRLEPTRYVLAPISAVAAGGAP